MKKFLPFFLVLILLLIIKNSISTIVKTLKNDNTSLKLKQQLAEEEKKNQYLKERLFYVRTNQFVEEEAREKLGMGKPGEFIVIAPTTAPLNSKKVVFDDRPNWKKWWELFF